MILKLVHSFSRREKYSSPQIQNEILKVMALHVVRNIAKSIQQAKFQLMKLQIVLIKSKLQFVSVLLMTIFSFKKTLLAYIL